jgi:putative restriction endonuclease
MAFRHAVPRLSGVIEDFSVRLAAFDWLRQQVAMHGDVLPWWLLIRGFDHVGQRVPLVSQQGIFKPAVDDSENALRGVDFEIAEPRREYVTATFRRRLHQLAFRERVLRAYQERCAMCRLRHRELLDAAHIVPDQEPEGVPAVSNGLSLCKLHHAAFDSLFVTVNLDYRVVVREDVLDEKDGPMLLHGLQELHGMPIQLPRRAEWLPSRDSLSQHLRRFGAAS